MRVTVLATFASLASGPLAAQDRQPLLQMVAPDLPAGSRLMGFSFDIVSGRIASLREAPAGWTVSIDNDPSWHARVTAHAVVGAAALDTVELARLFLLQETPSRDRIKPYDPISMSGSIDVMRGGDVQTIKEPLLRLNAVEPR